MYDNITLKRLVLIWNAFACFKRQCSLRTMPLVTTLASLPYSVHLPFHLKYLLGRVLNQLSSPQVLVYAFGLLSELSSALVSLDSAVCVDTSVHVPSIHVLQSMCLVANVNSWIKLCSMCYCTGPLPWGFQDECHWIQWDHGVSQWSLDTFVSSSFLLTLLKCQSGEANSSIWLLLNMIKADILIPNMAGENCPP